MKSYFLMRRDYSILSENQYLWWGKRERSKRILSTYHVYEHIPDLVGDKG